MSLKRAFVVPALAFCVGIGVFGSYQLLSHRQETRVQALLLEMRHDQWDRLRQALWQEIQQFQGQVGIVVEDLQTGWTVGYGYEKRFPAASVVKIPMMVACFQAVEEGKIRLDETVTLREKDKVSGSGILKEKPSGTVLTIEQLIALMISRSDNTATNLLIDRLGMDYFNQFFEKEGLSKTKLSRKMMDFSSRKKGVENYTSAEDIALSLQKIYHRQMTPPTISEKCLELLSAQMIKDRIPAKLPPETMVAHKTGLERGVCHDAGIVFTKEGNFLITVLTRNGKASAPSKRFIARLSRLTYDYLDNLPSSRL